jgi:hypothetical protein
MKPPAASILTLVLAGTLMAGCGGELQKSAEPREIGDKVTDADLDVFFQVVDDLPAQKLPEMPVLFKGPPTWEDHRTLPVNELVREETDELDKLWNDELLIRHLGKDRALQKALRERMSLSQFVGLVKTIGVALARNSVRPEQELRRILDQGKKRLEGLRAQTRRFNELKPDQRHTILTAAVWITRVDRARRLLLVPPENREMATTYFKRFEAIFPPEFTSNPFDSIADQIDELGMSFEELPQTGVDSDIEWSPSTALRGTDPPDVEVREAVAESAPKAPSTPAAKQDE